MTYDKDHPNYSKWVKCALRLWAESKKIINFVFISVALDTYATIATYSFNAGDRYLHSTHTGIIPLNLDFCIEVSGLVDQGEYNYALFTVLGLTQENTARWRAIDFQMKTHNATIPQRLAAVYEASR